MRLEIVIFIGRILQCYTDCKMRAAITQIASLRTTAMWKTMTFGAMSVIKCLSRSTPSRCRAVLAVLSFSCIKA